MHACIRKLSIKKGFIEEALEFDLDVWPKIYTCTWYVPVLIPDIHTVNCLSYTETRVNKVLYLYHGFVLERHFVVGTYRCC